MNAGFLSLYDPQRGTVPAFLQDGEVFDLSEVIGVNILGLIRTRKLNSQTFFAVRSIRLESANFCASAGYFRAR